VDIGVTYANPELKAAHREAKFGLIAERLSIDVDEAQACYVSEQERLTNTLGWKPAGTYVMRSLGIPTEVYEAHNTAHVDPRAFLKDDPALRAALKAMAPVYRPVLVTNLGRVQVERTLSTTGILDLFACISSISDSGYIKPDPALLPNLLERLGARPSDCVAVGGRHSVDIAPAEALGIETRHVASRSDLIDFARRSVG
jgi:putative hydrolase of the HAD superfamily